MDHRLYFNRLALNWDEMAHHDEARLGLIVNHLELFPGCVLLDAGCGTGAFSRHAIAQCDFPLKVLCLDISEEMLVRSQMAMQGNEHIHFLQCDLTRPCLADKSLDRIICYSCFPHITDKARALSSLEKSLRNSGMLVIAHSDNYQKINEFHARCGEPVKYDYLPGPEEMTKLLESTGFSDILIVDEPHLFIASARPRRSTSL